MAGAGPRLLWFNRMLALVLLRHGTVDADRMNAAKEKEALLWGLVGVTLFAATLPMTRLAVGPADAPQLSPWFVTFGRAAVAGVLSLAYLLWQHSRGRLNVPRKAEWPLVGMTAFGVIVGFPLFLALALRHVPSTHGAVVTALLPLSTAVLGALWFRQRPSAGFGPAPCWAAGWCWRIWCGARVGCIWARPTSTSSLP
jgi:hypothetical protein